MTQLDKIETVLDDTLREKAPVQIPEHYRKSLAHALWWLALLFGVLQLAATWELWVSNGHGLFYNLTTLALFVDATFLLLAAPGLKAMARSGWVLVFYSVLLNVVYGVCVFFSDYGDRGDLAGSLAWSVAGAYLLFQVRDHFKVEVKARKADTKANE